MSRIWDDWYKKCGVKKEAEPKQQTAVERMEAQRAAFKAKCEEVKQKTGFHVSYSISHVEGWVEVCGTKMTFKGTNCFFYADTFPDGFLTGTKNSKQQLVMRSDSSEKLWEPHHKDMAKVAIQRFSGLSTEGLLMIMREMFIMGANERKGGK